LAQQLSLVHIIVKMKSFLFPLAVLASTAMAQTTSACGADYIVETCLGSERAKLNACTNEDWDCLCQGWKNIIAYATFNTQTQLLFSQLTDYLAAAATSTAPTIPVSVSRSAPNMTLSLATLLTML